MSRGISLISGSDQMGIHAIGGSRDCLRQIQVRHLIDARFALFQALWCGLPFERAEQRLGLALGVSAVAPPAREHDSASAEVLAELCLVFAILEAFHQHDHAAIAACVEVVVFTVAHRVPRKVIHRTGYFPDFCNANRMKASAPGAVPPDAASIARSIAFDCCSRTLR